MKDAAGADAESGLRLFDKGADVTGAIGVGDSEVDAADGEGGAKAVAMGMSRILCWGGCSEMLPPTGRLSWM